MAVYTYTGNLDPGERTSVLVLRDGALRVPIMSWADFTAPELAFLQTRFVLVPGMIGTGPAVSVENIELWKSFAMNPDALIVGPIIRNSDGIAMSAGVVWPDGITGTYTATVLDDDGVLAYTVTKGSATYTQPTMTRDSSSGAIVDRPAITVI